MAIKTFSSGEVLTAADTNTYLTNSGLVYITQQTVGSGVGSVTVSSVFTSAYASYRIIYVGGSQSISGEIRMTLVGSAANYYSSIIYATWAGVTGGTGGNNIAYWNVGSGRTSGNSVCIDIHQPQSVDRAWFNGSYVGIDAGSVGGSANGYHNSNTQHTSFTFNPSAGTFSGGIIYVYGYRKA